MEQQLYSADPIRDHYEDTPNDDHQSETRMMTQQMCLMDFGKRAGIGFCMLQSKLCLPMCGVTAVGIQRLSNLNKRLEVWMNSCVVYDDTDIIYY